MRLLTLVTETPERAPVRDVPGRERAYLDGLQAGYDLACVGVESCRVFPIEWARGFEAGCEMRAREEAKERCA